MMFLVHGHLVLKFPPPTGVREIFSPVGSSGLDSCSPKELISVSTIFHSAFYKDDEL